jgi:hypothetical protein
VTPIHDQVIKAEIPNAAVDAADATEVEMSILSHVVGWSAEKRAKYAEYVTQQSDARGPAMICEGDKVGFWERCEGGEVHSRYTGSR